MTEQARRAMWQIYNTIDDFVTGKISGSAFRNKGEGIINAEFADVMEYVEYIRPVIIRVREESKSRSTSTSLWNPLVTLSEWSKER
jgi:hypothetical protein